MIKRYQTFTLPWSLPSMTYCCPTLHALVEMNDVWSWIGINHVFCVALGWLLSYSSSLLVHKEKPPVQSAELCQDAEPEGSQSSRACVLWHESSKDNRQLVFFLFHIQAQVEVLQAAQAVNKLCLCSRQVKALRLIWRCSCKQKPKADNTYPTHQSSPPWRLLFECQGQIRGKKKKKPIQVEP